MGKILVEPVRVLFHLNGYTKVMLERTEGHGMADGGIVWELWTKDIPVHLRQIGCRFVVKSTDDEIEIFDLNESPPFTEL